MGYERYVNSERQILKENQEEILEMKGTIKSSENSVESLPNRLDPGQDRISEHKDKVGRHEYSHALKGKMRNYDQNTHKSGTKLRVLT